MPLPNARLLHPAFHENVRASAVGDAGLPDECTIHRPGSGGTVGERHVWQPAAPTLVYTGGCRAQPEVLSQARTVDAGDDDVTLHRYRVTIRSDAPQILLGDVLTVTASADQQLVRRPLIVRDVTYDTFQARRYLLAEDHPEHPTPEA